MNNIKDLNSTIIARQNASGIENSKYIPKEFQENAKEYEAQFIKLMLEEMEKSAAPQEQSSATEIYNNLLRQERSKLIAEKDGGLGFQKMILDQIYPQRRRNQFAYDAYMKQKEEFLKQRHNTMMGAPEVKGE